MKRAILTSILTLALLAGCGGQPGTETTTLLEAAIDDFYTGRNEAGLEKVEQVLAEDPDHAAALAVRAALNGRLGMPELSTADIDRALELEPDLALAHAAQAAYFFTFTTDMHFAASETARALELDPDLAFAHSIQGSLHWYVDDDLPAALDSYERAVELEPGYYNARLRLGDVRGTMGDSAGALAEYTRAIEINPDDVGGYFSRGYGYLYEGDGESALADFAKALEVDPNDAFSYDGRASAYSLLGDNEAASADYAKALSLAPDEPMILNNAAYHMAVTDGDLTKALEYVEQALARTPDDPFPLDTKAFIQYKLGEYDAALEIFDSLIAQGFTPSYYGRGLVYEAQGENDKAIADLQAFVAEFPDDPQSADALAHLEALGAAP